MVDENTFVFTVTGYFEASVEAENLDDAKEKANKEFEETDFLDMTEVANVKISDIEEPEWAKEREDAMDKKIKALATYFEIDESRIKKADEPFADDTMYVIDNEYMFTVATDAEADHIAADDIKESLWAFNSDFICSHSTALQAAGPRAEQALQKMQAELCESANPLVEAMIDDMDDFIQDAISCDGRGHFIAQYDGDENEVEVDGEDFYIYCHDTDSIERSLDERGDF